MDNEPGELNEHPHSFSPTAFFDLTQTAHGEIFHDVEWVWEVLPKIGDYISQRLEPGREGADIAEGSFVGERVALGEGTVVEPGAIIKGPAIIGKNSTIRSGAYVRENAIIGNGVTIGNSCEVKNALVFNEAEIPHFNYVGDSVIGFHGHLGAGVILSNVRLDRQEVVVKASHGRLPTHLRKFGAIIGDYAEIGCNAVISPGSVIGQRSVIYPLTSFGGVIGPDKIVKLRQETEITDRQS